MGTGNGQEPNRDERVQPGAQPENNGEQPGAGNQDTARPNQGQQQGQQGQNQRGTQAEPGNQDQGQQQDQEHGQDEQDPRVKKANDEAKRYRLQLREAEKQVETLTARVSKMETAQQEAVKGELDQLKADLQAANERAEAADLAARRLQIATKAGLDPAMADRLKGSTDEELTADATALAKLMPGRNARKGNGTGGGQPSLAEQLQSRIKGKSENVFDPTYQRSIGGGPVGHDD